MSGSMRTKNEHKALRNLVHGKREREYEAMIADRRPKSWSAAHPLYTGTSLCPDPRYRGGKER